MEVGYLATVRFLLCLYRDQELGTCVLPQFCLQRGILLLSSENQHMHSVTVSDKIGIVE